LAVSASIVSAQLLDLREELGRARSAGVDGVHVDLEDAGFVPAMGLGIGTLRAVAEWGGLPVDAHLMVEDPERVVELIGAAPVEAIAIHAESTHYPRRVLRLIQESGRRAGLALNPSSAVPDLAALAPHLDYLLMLTTEPEHLDPPFLEARLDAVASAAEQCAALGVTVVVDGGVDPANAARIAAAGSRAVVVGRALFSADDLSTAVTAIQAAA
jgi:ribulose-phosphate 3-epimerase